MATHRFTFPTTEEQIRELRAGDEVTVDGHIIGIRDRTQIRIFDQGHTPPLDLTGGLLLHTAPNVRKLGPGRYEKLCIGTTTSARMVRFTEPLGEAHHAGRRRGADADLLVLAGAELADVGGGVEQERAGPPSTGS